MKFFLALFLTCSTMAASGQRKSYPFYQLYQLDSIAASPSIGRHFGALYADFLGLVEEQLTDADSSTTRLVRHFEQVFAGFFIDACIAYRDKKQIELPAWRSYFADTTLSAEQYNLIGTNAHLNGGLAEAISQSYTPADWQWLKAKYVLFNKCLNQTYEWVYRETTEAHTEAKRIHVFSLGISKAIGRYYLYKWRKRQMRLTELYFAGSGKYDNLLDKINRKKDKVDRLIVKKLK